HDLDDLLREVARVGGRVLDPRDARLTSDPLEQVREGVLLEATPRWPDDPVGIGVHVLSDEMNLAVSGRAEAANLLDHAVCRTAPLLPPGERDDTIGAALVAAFDNRHECNRPAPPLARAHLDKVRPVLLTKVDCPRKPRVELL